MKKHLSLMILTLFLVQSAVCARTVYNYDSTIKVSNTIRYQKKLNEQRMMARKNVDGAAAAAKINYEEEPPVKFNSMKHYNNLYKQNY